MLRCTVLLPAAASAASAAAVVPAVAAAATVATAAAGVVMLFALQTVLQRSNSFRLLRPPPAPTCLLQPLPHRLLVLLKVIVVPNRNGVVACMDLAVRDNTNSDKRHVMIPGLFENCNAI
jgi:hypothetical protein